METTSPIRCSSFDEESETDALNKPKEKNVRSLIRLSETERKIGSFRSLLPRKSFLFFPSRSEYSTQCLGWHCKC